MSYDANNAYPAGPGATGPGAMGPGAPIRGATSPEDLSLPLYGASFGQAVKRFFKKYATFTGRASRSEFWWVALFGFLLAIVPYVLMIIGAVMSAGAAASVDPYDPVATQAATSGPGMVLVAIGGILMLLIALAMIVPTLAINWRRLHDANFSGLFYLLTLTSIGGIVVFVMTLLPPKAEGQRFDV